MLAFSAALFQKVFSIIFSELICSPDYLKVLEEQDNYIWILKKMSKQLYSGPRWTQTPGAGLEVDLTDCFPVLGATALEQALHERSSNGATTMTNQSRKGFEKMWGSSVATCTCSSIMRNTGWLWGGCGVRKTVRDFQPPWTLFRTRRP